MVIALIVHEMIQEAWSQGGRQNIPNSFNAHESKLSIYYNLREWIKPAVDIIRLP